MHGLDSSSNDAGRQSITCPCTGWTKDAAFLCCHSGLDLTHVSKSFRRVDWNCPWLRQRLQWLPSLHAISGAHAEYQNADFGLGAGHRKLPAPAPPRSDVCMCSLSCCLFFLSALFVFTKHWLCGPMTRERRGDLTLIAALLFLQLVASAKRTLLDFYHEPV